MKKPIRVLLVDDHAIVRDGIRSLLKTQPDIEVVGEANNGQAAVSTAESLHPDVVLMDLVMPGMDGIEAIRRIVNDRPESRILVLTSFSAEDKVFPAIKAGAMGYLLKDCDSEELVRAIHQVYLGEPSLHPKIARMLLREVTAPRGEGIAAPPPRPERPAAVQRPAVVPRPTVDPLTERELEVLKLVAQGKSNREIADELVVSKEAVRTHVSSILSKLHLASRTQATLFALRKGLTSLDDGSSPLNAGHNDPQAGL
jgi:NarL family two-component system response regulator LiaR